MKKLITFVKIIGMACLIVAMGCATSGEMQKTGNGEVRDTTIQKVNNPQMTLADYLRKVPGVTVFGGGNNISVQVRGVNSFRGGATHPLFVVDGQRVGFSYRNVANFVNVHDVDHIKVLKGSDATLYGVEGGGGVILIVTKS